MPVDKIKALSKKTDAFLEDLRAMGLEFVIVIGNPDNGACVIANRLLNNGYLEEVSKAVLKLVDVNYEEDA